MGVSYRWSLKDYPESHGHTVFTTFACGGGSTMGYKLAGFNVVGANDVDPKMAKIYQANHHPKQYFLEDIRELAKRPKSDFEDVDILDGSPPCTTFSMAGKREKSWGKERKYAEGAITQTLDDLYFRFLDFASVVQPKIIVSENVSGLVKGSAKVYWKNIIKKFDEIGYTAQTFLLNSATMGVPQRRERVFIIGHKKDLDYKPLVLNFNEKPIPFGEFRSEKGRNPSSHDKKLLLHYQDGDRCIADIVKRVNGKLSGFGAAIVDDTTICPTIIATGDNHRSFDKMVFSESDYTLASSFPYDYDFCGLKVKYVVGMSVPPLMMKGVADSIYEQWLKV